MKFSNLKIVLSILLMAVCFAATAQQKPTKPSADTTHVKTPVVKTAADYKPDPNKIYRIVLDLKADEASAVMGVMEGVIHKSSKLSGDQIDEAEQTVKFISRKIIKPQLDYQYQEAVRVFLGDSLKSEAGSRKLEVKPKSK
jgi:hypothetical protein